MMSLSKKEESGGREEKEIAPNGLIRKEKTVISVIRYLFGRFRKLLITQLRRTDGLSVFRKSTSESSIFDVLNEDCFLYVACMLNNKDRRHLSQTCRKYQYWIKRRKIPSLETGKHVESVLCDLNKETYCHGSRHQFFLRDGTVRYASPFYDKDRRTETALQLCLRKEDYSFRQIVDDICEYWYGGIIYLEQRSMFLHEPIPIVHDQCIQRLVDHSETLLNGFRQIRSLHLDLESFSDLLPGVDRLIVALMSSEAKSLQVRALARAKNGKFSEKVVEVAERIGWRMSDEVRTEYLHYGFCEQFDVYSFSKNGQRKLILVRSDRL